MSTKAPKDRKLKTSCESPEKKSKLKFTCFIGIDQTGAALSQGRRARPLECAVLYLSSNSGQQRWYLSSHQLPSLTQTSVQNLLLSLKLDHLAASSVALIVDCVVGLASGVSSQGVWELMQGTQVNGSDLHGNELPRFGRPTAEAYFAKLLGGVKPLTDLPRRQCELLANANSVFLTRPFQKNIQTGTYRIWKDVSESGTQWLNFWPFEEATRALPRPWFFEAYPSWIWKEILGLRTRDLKLLKSAVQEAFGSLPRLKLDIQDWSQLLRNADSADAAVLALGALKLQNEDRLIEPDPDFLENPFRLTEGWIMGLKWRK